MIDKQPMELYLDLDWTTMKCPCGKTLCSRYATDQEWRQFEENHVKHTNGKLLEICTDEGAKVYNRKPEPQLVSLNLE